MGDLIFHKDILEDQVLLDRHGGIGIAAMGPVIVVKMDGEGAIPFLLKENVAKMNVAAAAIIKFVVVLDHNPPDASIIFLDAMGMGWGRIGAVNLPRWFHDNPVQLVIAHNSIRVPYLHSCSPIAPGASENAAEESCRRLLIQIIAILDDAVFNPS